MGMNKSTFTNSLFFLISPLISIGHLFLFNKRRNQDLIITLLISLTSYLFKPTHEMDKFRHFETYEILGDLNIKNYFSVVFDDGFDFLFRLCLFIGSHSSLSFHIVVFVLTFITVWLIVKSFRGIYKDIVGNIENIHFSIFIYLVISFVDLFSGIRFMLAAAFLISALHQYWTKRIDSIFWLKLSLSVFTHFSLIIMIIPLILDWIFKFFGFTNVKKYFWISFSVFLIPKSYLMTILISSGISEFLSLESKVDFYINEIGLEINNSFSQVIIDQVNILWLPVVMIIILNQRNHSKLENYLIFLIITSLIFFSFKIVFFRYLLLVKLISCIYLFSTKLNKINSYLFLLAQVFWLISFIFQVIILRDVLSVMVMVIVNSIFTILILLRGSFSLNSCN
jgi:hypothetical protein